MEKHLRDEFEHKPVLAAEVLSAFGLNELKDKELKIIDTTLGLGGHTEAMVKSGANVLGIDADRETLKFAEEKLSIACPIPENPKDFRGLWKLRHGNFRDIDKIALEEDFSDVDGVLMDLGVSSPQITSSVRGISFQNDNASLDMRLDYETQEVRGSDLLNALRVDQLAKLFEVVMDFKTSKGLARKVEEYRSIKKIETVGDFKIIIDRVIRKFGKLEPYTLPFLALRIAVNNEFDNLKEGLTRSLSLLKDGGRLVVISFHSGEDRIVKQFFVEMEKFGFKIVNGLIMPKDSEISENKRARSAKMRILQKYD